MAKLSKEDKNDFISLLDNNADLELISLKLKEYQNFELEGGILGRIFLAYFPPNKEGFTRLVSMEELEKLHKSFHTTNGGDWCRSNQSWLGKQYVIKRFHDKGSISGVKLDGINKNKIEKYRNISKRIVDVLKNRKCAILHISDVEIDHKNGKYTDWENQDTKMQKLEDFQPLSKAANDAKRQHCKECKDSKSRFNAKVLGYKEGYIFGDENTETCVGCYWYDPHHFNEIISKDYEKEC